MQWTSTHPVGVADRYACVNGFLQVIWPVVSGQCQDQAVPVWRCWRALHAVLHCLHCPLLRLRTECARVAAANSSVQENSNS